MQKLLNCIENQEIFFEITNYGNLSAIKFKADDEKLYVICCAIAEYIISSEGESCVYRALNREYSCFNRDERELVKASVLKSDELSELPGRIYIYLKCNESINPRGFYRFMCRDMAECIYSLVSEEADRILRLNDTADLISLLRYFASMSPVCCERVDIIAEKDSLMILNPDRSDGLFGEEFANMDLMCEDTLCELVSLNPQKIVVHGKKYFDENEHSSVINGVFGGKIDYCSGCPLCKRT